MTRRGKRILGLIGLAVILPVAFCLIWAFPRSKSGPNVFAPPVRDTITFWGHACLYIDVDGFGIVTDPVFDERYQPASSRLINGPDREACEDVSLILISHAHTDHLSPESLDLFPDTVQILCSPPSAKHLAGRKFTVLKLWEERKFGDISVTAVPADHAGGRMSLNAEPDGRALGFVVRTPRGTIYYSGDTRYFDGFAEIGRRCSPDLAIFNVNSHLRFDAARAADEVGAPLVIPAHHGAFVSPTSGKNAKWRAAVREVAGDGYAELQVGESIPLERLGHGR